MAVLAGCHSTRNAVDIREIPCPECRQVLECFFRDRILVTDVQCEHCGFCFPAGTQEKEITEQK